MIAPVHLARRCLRLALRLVLPALALLTPAAWSAELPVANEALLLLRVLAYDRQLPARAGGTVEIAVVFKKGNLASEAAGEDLARAFGELVKSSVLSGLPIRVWPVAIRSADELSAALAERRPAAAFICAGLESEAAAISAVTRARSVLSAAGSRAMVEAGISIGLVSRSGRAGLVVNLPASRLEGADLDSAMLKLAEVLR